MSIDTFLLSADTTDLNYPEVRPTLDLNFARVKALDPRITFTRSSGGSYVGADGLIKYAGVNEARFDHDPYTGESLGLLIEESRTNLSLNSQDFTDNTSLTAWTVLPTTSRAYLIANTGIDDPSGGITASRWASGTNSAEELIFHQLPSALTIGVTYIASVWIRRVSGTGEVRLIIGDNVTINVTSQLNSVPYGTWVRCNATRTITGASGGTSRAYITVYPSNFFSGTPTTIDIWGYQMEQGAFPTSYIPTVASTRTRAADNASITGKNFSEWYRQDEGTIYSNQTFNGTLTAGNFGAVWSINNFPNDIVMTYNPNNFVGFFVRNNNVVQANFFPTVNVKVPFKNIVTVKTKDFVQISNVFSPQTTTSGVLPNVVGPFVIGGSVSNGTKGAQTIARLTYYPKRLPNAQLQALTR